jgi:hypothetical protein
MFRSGQIMGDLITVIVICMMLVSILGSLEAAL